MAASGASALRVRPISAGTIAMSGPTTRPPARAIIAVAMTMEELSYEGTTKALELSIEKVRVMN